MLLFLTLVLFYPTTEQEGSLGRLRGQLQVVLLCSSRRDVAVLG
jgi:hypothetical protein